MIQLNVCKRLCFLCSCCLVSLCLSANNIWDNDLQSTWFSSGRSGGMSRNTTPEPESFSAPVEDVYWLPCLLAGCYVVYGVVKRRGKKCVSE